MRLAMIAIVAACGGSEPTASAPTAGSAHPKPEARSAKPGGETYATLREALRATIPADARVIGFGELHARTDRAQIKTTLARFTEDGLPAIADKLSDLVIETWFVDPHCGSAAVEATAKVEVTMRRPAETKSDITKLAEAARAAGIQPHAMRITCDDYARIAPPGKDVQPEALLDLATRELGRIASEAVAHRDREAVALGERAIGSGQGREAARRPWVAVYGGAVHPARFPAKGTEEWSYAATVDRATGGHFVEIDLIEPELAEADPVSQREPWFALVRDASDGRVRAWRRGERSVVLVLPRSPTGR